MTGIHRRCDVTAQADVRFVEKIRKVIEIAFRPLKKAVPPPGAPSPREWVDGPKIGKCIQRQGIKKMIFLQEAEISIPPPIELLM